LSQVLALTAHDLTQLPSKRDEDWRWTDLRGLIRQPLELSRDVGTIQEGGPFKGLAGDEIVIANGRLNWWPEDDLSDGLELACHASPDAPIMAEKLPMAALAARHPDSEIPVNILSFTGGKTNLASVRFVSRAEGTAHHVRFGVVVKAGVKATLLESYEGTGWDSFTNVLVEFFLERGASIERIVVTDEVPTSVSVSTAEVHMAEDSAFNQTVLTSGAKRQRIETRVTHPGHGAKVRMDGAYLLSDKRHSDITTMVVHDGVDGTTEQLTKGVVRDQARGIFQGRIVVSEGADRTDARMGHHALILSERAEVDAKPELLIHADDVQCAHGNTIGALDEAAIFYARQRGIPDTQARAMLTEAFIGEVIDRIGHEGARDAARAWAARRLGGY